MTFNVQPRPEILAPVGTWEMCQAAVHNGADAIYIGTPHFNARGRTRDFSTSEVQQIIQFCHLRGVKVFLACNVLIFEKELAEVERILRELIPLRPDAFIVQDIGLVRLMKRLAPWQEVHASTQMTVSNYEAIELTSDLGISRYVLARECSLAEIRKIREHTEKELEVFVHGALCVSYSGQCLTSESHGGRSANRGQCAQSCRLGYELVVDGERRELGEKRYLVSPQDLCGLEDVPRLLEAGVDSFKIEGRLKTPEYVASTVQNYRDARDAALRSAPLDQLDQRVDQLSLVFARGHFNGWLDGVNHQRLVDARFSRPVGIPIGEVLAVDRAGIEISGDAQLSAGDGVVFYQFGNEREVGAIVFGCTRTERGSRLRCGEEFDLRAVTRGMKVFHNSSSRIEKQLRYSFQDKREWRRVRLSGELSGAPGAPLVLTISDPEGRVVSATTNSVLAPAEKAPLTRERAAEEIGALGGTCFELHKLSFLVKGACFIHNRELKDLRRRAIDELTALRVGVRREDLAPEQVVFGWRTEVISQVQPAVECAQPAVLNVLIRDESQLEALPESGVGTVFLDYEFNKDYERSLREVRTMGFRCGIATTRIMKPGELGHLKYIERLAPDCILVRNLGALNFYREKSIPLVGDFSLNVTNSLSAEYFLGKGLSRLCPSYDLNQWQLLDLLEALPAERFEVTVHQYMPAFHMEHCVYAAFLSSGSSYRDCGRPCEKHRVELRDPDGTLHPLKPDAECRNTMFQGKPQAAVRLIPELVTAGVRHFRVEALFETPVQLRAKIDAYRALLADQISLDDAVVKIGTVERYGITEGQLFNSRVYENKKKDLLSVLP